MENESKGKKKWIKWVIPGTILFVILAFAAIIWIQFNGNPIRRFTSKKHAIQYVKEEYPNLDLKVDCVGYDFKMGNYVVNFKSEKSVDTQFAVFYSCRGEFRGDDYKERVANKWNTASRIAKAYEDRVDPILEAKQMPGNCDIAYAMIRFDSEIDEETALGEHWLKTTQLELDKEYDLDKMGEQYGHLVLYAQSGEVTVVNAAKILLEIHEYLQKNNVKYHSVDFVLYYERPENEDEPRPEGEVRVEGFEASMIYEEGLVERMTNWNCVRQ